MTEIRNKDRILEAIDQLRRRKARPDIDRICNFVFRRFGVDCNDTLEDLQRLVDAEVVIKVEYKGNTSYRNAAKWSKYAMYKNRELRNSSGSTEIHNILSRAFASLLVEDPDYLDIGVPRTELERFMLQDDPLTDLTEIELILTKETGSGFLVKLKNGNYSLADHPVPPSTSPRSISPVTSSPITVQAKGVQQSFSVHAAEKPAKPPKVKTSSPHKEKKPKIEALPPPPAATTATTTTVTTSSPVATTSTSTATAPSTSSMPRTPTKAAPKTPPKATASSSHAHPHAHAHASGSGKASELGAINVGGYRVGVRRKTAKKVFDPSDNYTPTRKRGRPAGSGSSSRKDGQQGGVCCLCNGTLTISSSSSSGGKDASRKAASERLLQCRDCSNRAHPSCISGKHRGKDKPLLNQWVCHGCKLCAFCFETSENEAMAVCVECGDAYHLTCHNPPVNDEQWRNKWVCSSCEDIDKADVKPFDAKQFDANVKQFDANVKQFDANTKQFDAKPLDTKPLDTKPLDTKPFDTKPFDAKPFDAKQFDVSLFEAKPVDNEPIDVKPVITKLVDVKPIDINPVVKPFEIKPSTSKGTVVKEVPSTSTSAMIKRKRLLEDPFFKKYVPKERTPDPTNWTVDDVCKYLKEHGCGSQAEAFRHHEIDGRSLLLLSRRDVLYELGLKLGPALKVNHFVQLLQKKDIRKVFPFNEMLG